MKIYKQSDLTQKSIILQLQDEVSTKVSELNSACGKLEMHENEKQAKQDHLKAVKKENQMAYDTLFNDNELLKGKLRLYTSDIERLTMKTDEITKYYNTLETENLKKDEHLNEFRAKFEAIQNKHDYLSNMLEKLSIDNENLNLKIGEKNRLLEEFVQRIEDMKQGYEQRFQAEDSVIIV